MEEVRLRINQERWDYALAKATADDRPTLLSLWVMVQNDRNVVKEMVATLRCNKPARPADRELQGSYQVVFEVLTPVDPWLNEVREVGRLQMGLSR